MTPIDVTRARVCTSHARNCSLSNAHSRYWYEPVWHTDTEIDSVARVACSNGRRGGEGERKKKRYLERCFGILREVVIFVLRNDLGETCYRIIISFSSLFSFFLPEFFEEESSLGETIDDSRRNYFFFFFFFSFFSLLCKMFKEFFLWFLFLLF